MLVLCFRNYIQLVHRTQRCYCKKIEVTDENAPIKFSTSPAAKPKIIIPFKRDARQSMPWYQPIVVVTSVAAFLIYFCILREESDIDEEFSKTLYDRIDGLEKMQLIQAYKTYKEEGKSVVEIEKRLQELEAES